jgi:large-conductance mechanosensitive channel
LHLSSSPSCCILWEVFNIVDSVVETILYAIVEVLNTTNLLAGPTSSVLREVGNVVAKFVETVLDTILVTFKIFL